MNTTVTDPVCGMTIDPEQAAGSSEYEGETYSFCARGCQTKFEAAPRLYAGVPAEPAGAGSCCSPARACC